MAVRTAGLLLFISIVSVRANNRNEGFIERLKNNGMKLATDFLGSESVALKVADFVVRAFQTGNRVPFKSRPDSFVDGSSHSEETSNEKRPNYNIFEAQSPVSPWRHIVRLLGLQPNQISAVAVNALVFIAQMISTFLAGPKGPRKPFPSNEPLTWILNKNSRRLQELIATAKNESLPELVEELIKERETEEETSCIRLLICKITPFVSNMQKAVFGNNNQKDSFEESEGKIRGAAILYRHLPSADEVIRRSNICEKRFIECDLNE